MTGILAWQILFLGFGVGLIGAMVGIGGGVLLVPILTLGFGVPIKTAIGASAVAVIATSCTSASKFLRQRLTNLRLSLLLLTVTIVGAILGGLTATILSREVLSGVFALVLLGTAISMFQKLKPENRAVDGLDVGRFGDIYFDPYLKCEAGYCVRCLPLGLFISFLAGNVSGLLGIGGGVIQVPMMVLALGLPMRVAAATSSFMIGVTAAASSLIYYTHGFINPLVAAPTALGIFGGAWAGARLASRVKGNFLSRMLAVILLILALQMALAAFGIRLR